MLDCNLLVIQARFYACDAFDLVEDPRASVAAPRAAHLYIENRFLGHGRCGCCAISPRNLCYSVVKLNKKNFKGRENFREEAQALSESHRES